jgi:acyl carrier protein
MTVLERLKKVISENLDVSQSDIKPESSFTEDLGADSLDLVQLVMALEDEFKLTISDAEAEKLLTVKAVIDYLEDEGVK